MLHARSKIRSKTIGHLGFVSAPYATSVVGWRRPRLARAQVDALHCRLKSLQRLRGVVLVRHANSAVTHQALLHPVRHLGLCDPGREASPECVEVQRVPGVRGRATSGRKILAQKLRALRSVMLAGFVGEQGIGRLRVSTQEQDEATGLPRPDRRHRKRVKWHLANSVLSLGRTHLPVRVKRLVHVGVRDFPVQDHVRASESGNLAIAVPTSTRERVAGSPFLRNLFASEQPLCVRFGYVDHDVVTRSRLRPRQLSADGFGAHGVHRQEAVVDSFVQDGP
ncbi:MAG: hypothetical protein IT377_01385 [Polyangiaceae bacterium]|nr:hypothetical protein [Polyangiaceae bacterium]